jgi:hypothetical protein
MLHAGCNGFFVAWPAVCKGTSPREKVKQKMYIEGAIWLSRFALFLFSVIFGVYSCWDTSPKQPSASSMPAITLAAAEIDRNHVRLSGDSAQDTIIVKIHTEDVLLDTLKEQDRHEERKLELTNAFGAEDRNLRRDLEDIKSMYWVSIFRWASGAIVLLLAVLCAAQYLQQRLTLQRDEAYILAEAHEREAVHGKE